MARYVTTHTEGCESPDNSQVFWDQESNTTACRDCGAELELEEEDAEED